jgi:cbb3-type cytochrome oxidase cytochrome c subunit
LARTRRRLERTGLFQLEESFDSIQNRRHGRFVTTEDENFAYSFCHLPSKRFNQSLANVGDRLTTYLHNGYLQHHLSVR